MKPFELYYLSLEQFLPALYKQVRSHLFHIARSYTALPKFLDVGGRNSHYTIGVPASITVTDLPRETALQQSLHLGVTDEMKIRTMARRSNIHQILYDDMTHSLLPDNTYDGVVAVEVLEHVAEDDLFIQQVYRVLKSGGTFVMTTPNGDFVANKNPDHKRHYKRSQLQQLLGTCFEEVDVIYAIKGGRFRRWSLRPWTLKRPLQTILAMIGGFVNGIESNSELLKEQPHGTHNLLAIAKRVN